PYILFLFGGIGWFISVLEAMVAAPLVALGITHPKGHDLLGRSEQSIMLLLGIFLKPVLMVIGLLAAMVLTRVTFGLLNSGFYGVMRDIFTQYNVSDGIAMGPILLTAFLVVYIVLVMSLAKACFSLITVLPEKV